MQVRALKRSKERQESRMEDLVKFETLCCRGNGHACERLGGKRHRAGFKCWICPKICYHCDLINSGSKPVDAAAAARIAQMKPIKIQGWSHLTSVNGRLEQTAAALNEHPVNFNKMMSAQVSPSLESTLRFRALASFMSAWHAKQESCTQEGTGAQVDCGSAIQTKPDADTLVPSIEGNDLERLPPKIEQDAEREDNLIVDQFRRSQAPSPEMLETNSHSQSWQLFSAESCARTVQEAKEAMRRDPRCEVRFMLN